MTLFYIIAALITVINIIILVLCSKALKKANATYIDFSKHFLPVRGKHYLPEKYRSGFAIRNEKGQDLLRTSKPLIEP